MIIEETRDINVIMSCLPAEQMITNKGRDKTRIQDRLLFFQGQLENPMFTFLVAHDNEKILGYSASIVEVFPKKKIYLLRFVAKTKEVREGIEEKLRTMAKFYKIKTAHITVRKGAAALKRKYGFVPISINMEKDLT